MRRSACWLAQCAASHAAAAGTGAAASASAPQQQLVAGTAAAATLLLQQRLLSSLQCTTSSPGSSGPVALAGHSQQQQGACSASTQPHHNPFLAAAGAMRSYARAGRDNLPRSGPRGGSGGGSSGGSGGARSRDAGRSRGGGGGASPAPPRSMRPLGRLPPNCPQLSALPPALEQKQLAAFDPWRSHPPGNAPEVPGGSTPGPMPRSLEAEKGEDSLQYSLLFREQLENSALPPALKRAAFDQPWEEVMVDARRTVKVTAKGRLETVHVTTAVGNGKGLIGIGMTAGSDVQQVVLNSLLAAYRNVMPVPLYRGHTIYHPIDLNIRKIRIRMWPREEGFGITASPLMETLCDLIGLRNVTIKLNGRRRHIDNAVKAWLQAVTSQVPPHDGVEGSGVYVREVYHRPKLPYGLVRGVDV